MARMRKRTRYEELQDAASEKGIWVATYSPGDGITRYRFFANPGNSYFGPDNGIVTVLGSKKAWEFVEAYGWGRGSSRDSSKSPRSRKVLITRKKYTRTNGSVKVKKSQYRVKARDPKTTKGSARKARVDRKGTAKPRSRIVGRFPEGQCIGPFSTPPGGYEYRESKTRRPGSRRDLQLKDVTLASRGPVCPVGTQVQTLILSQQFFNQREASSWIRRHGFCLTKIDESANFWRFRQQNPDAFEKDSFRTIRLRPGVEAVIGCPRN